MTARLLIEYDGARFAGWARQPGERTVQGELERALAVVRRAPTTLTVAGRTDRGVHAWAQVASHPGSCADARRLNAVLPADVAVVASGPAPDGFDARRHARSRTYCYRLLVRPSRPAVDVGRVLHWPWHLDRAALEVCARALPGTHDFTAFTPTETTHVRLERDVVDARWVEHGDELRFWIEADSFMRRMNRILVGTMIEAAAGRRDPRDFGRLLEGAPRTAAGVTAPAHGLALAAVRYDRAPASPTTPSAS